ncbi:Acetyltransferase (GNAT) domain-containing protein [Ralstonia sp. 25mfcol4.1]|nr:Acetyltransferase (GNAT) domain-containing protein [Ralstonia sp. 25mfcol4.1]
MTTYAQAGVEADKLLRYRALFLKCFPTADKFRHPAFLRWLYAGNPDGQVVGFDAFDGDLLIAHYACVPAMVRIGGSQARALLSLNTATHPEYQGKGLFTQLANMTYRHAAELGFDCVYGVANANSTPGFVRKLGFQLVQPLDARLGIGGLGIDFDAVARNAEFERTWTREAIGWRQANPVNAIQCQRHGQKLSLTAQASGRILSAYAELPVSAALQSAATGGRGAPFRLYLGLTPDGACEFHTYAQIPARLRPSPLNLIYRSLQGESRQLTRGHVQFSFLDFDAY